MACLCIRRAMRYLSICSGIEAATVAWEPMGWLPVAFSEIEAFPRAVLRHHYPQVPLHGDFTTIQGDEYGPADVLVGGTPCQSFSVAGLRGGLADDRGNLALEFLRLAQRTRPKWLVWENVPGVLSSNGGRDFGSILGGLVELGYGFAYRVLDAQFFGVPQRRRRVFVVGCLGDWRRAAAVLFERHSLQGHSAPRQQARQDVAGSLGAGSKRSGGRVGRREAAANHVIASGITGRAGNGSRQAGGNGNVIADLARCDTARQTRLDWETENFVTHALRADGFDASEDGTGRGTPLVAFSCKDHGADAYDGLAPTLRAMGHSESHANAGGQLAVAFHARQDPDSGPVTHPLDTDGVSIGVQHSWGVRRLTPRECERLQGFPDDYTLITYRGRLAADGPRYKALGNSMAVPVMRWIGERIALVEKGSNCHAQK